MVSHLQYSDILLYRSLKHHHTAYSSCRTCNMYIYLWEYTLHACLHVYWTMQRSHDSCITHVNVDSCVQGLYLHDERVLAKLSVLHGTWRNLMQTTTEHCSSKTAIVSGVAHNKCSLVITQTKYHWDIEPLAESETPSHILHAFTATYNDKLSGGHKVRHDDAHCYTSCTNCLSTRSNISPVAKCLQLVNFLRTLCHTCHTFTPVHKPSCGKLYNAIF